MRNMGWNRRRDALEEPCVELLEKAGWHVLRVSVKDGPDLVVSKAAWFTACLEIKSGKKKLKPGQQKWHDTWPGMTAVIHSVEEMAQWLRQPGL